MLIPCTCPNCGADINAHVLFPAEIMHEESALATCPRCQRTFSLAYRLEFVVETKSLAPTEE